VIWISEEQSVAIVSEALALAAAERAFIASVDPEGPPAPGSLVVATALAGHTFSTKPASTVHGAGVKIGSYWPSNDDAGLPRHSSAVVLLNPVTGRVGAIVETATGNAYRTAAADALAVRTLSRPDAAVLTVFGYGHQAYYEARAVAAVRPIDTIHITGRNLVRAQGLAERLTTDLGIPATATEPEAAVRAADILVTVTNTLVHSPAADDHLASPANGVDGLFDASWVRSGTHISAMGTDAPRKHELPTALYERALLFCDLPEQSRRLGEFQHASADTHVVQLGHVLIAPQLGRIGPRDITIFDSSGIGLQDLYLAIAILEAKGLRL
jgi:ornithine cyclodeaminase